MASCPEVRMQERPAVTPAPGQPDRILAGSARVPSTRT
jgi:hypothetical protein